LAQLTPAEAISSAAEQEVITRLTKFFDKTEQAEAQEFIVSLCREFSPSFVR
jgi:hypothetical protein